MGALSERRACYLAVMRNYVRENFDHDSSSYLCSDDEVKMIRF